MKKYVVATLLAGAIGVFAQAPKQPQAVRGNQTAKAANVATLTVQMSTWHE